MPLLKRLSHILSKTPFHPQWLVFNEQEKQINNLVQYSKGVVLDIGCSDQFLKEKIPGSCEYIGLDYYSTSQTLYKTDPMIFGDAQNLPIKNQSIDTVYLLEVLEHIPDIESTISEINRVLKDEGLFIMSIPFLYPIHDAPYDFHRLTKFGLQRLADKYGFKILRNSNLGHPVYTACLLMNIAFSKTILNSLTNKSIIFIFILFAPVLVPVLNLIGYLANKFLTEDEFMPSGYTLILKKSSS